MAAISFNEQEMQIARSHPEVCVGRGKMTEKFLLTSEMLEVSFRLYTRCEQIILNWAVLCKKFARNRVLLLY